MRGQFESVTCNHSLLRLKFHKKEGIIQEATNTIATVLEGTETITTLVGDVFDMIVSNPLLCVFVAASLLSVGIGIFKRIKRAAR